MYLFTINVSRLTFQRNAQLNIEMCIKNIEKCFVLEKTIFNIVSGIYFPGTY